ncbi:MAG: S41 family peptidase [Bacilli bacterium]|nr:S41 family peptidase [Bacilli bacterium]MBP3259452.1 S41 family peptidase [Bacilli bacterium]
MRKTKKAGSIKKSKGSIIKLSNVEFILVVIIGIAIGAGITLLCLKPTSSVGYKKVDSTIQSIIDSYNRIKDNYYKEIDEKELVNGAVKGMLEAIGDPYTTYMDEDLYSNFNITLNGSYEGLGVEISKQGDDIVIVGIFGDSPASKAGLKLGDKIISIDDLKSTDITTSEFSSYVRNTNKSTFKIVINRDNEEKTFEIKREKVVLKSVTSKVIEKNDKKIGYIYMSIFAANTYNQFKDDLESLEKQGIDSLIIDLRDNTGGELNSATSIISLFVGKENVIYQVENKNGDIEKTYSKGKKDKTYPIVVLVNNNTASASEVLTAALKDNLNAKVVGEKTFGKGTVQTVMNTSTGEQYKLTTKKWLTPNGEWINEKGIEPDIKVELSKDKDNQLEEAIKCLTNKES